MRPFFKDNDFNFLTEIALGSVCRQAADVGEVLTTADRSHDGKARTWIRGERIFDWLDEQIPA